MRKGGFVLGLPVPGKVLADGLDTVGRSGLKIAQDEFRSAYRFRAREAFSDRKRRAPGALVEPVTIGEESGPSQRESCGAFRSHGRRLTDEMNVGIDRHAETFPEPAAIVDRAVRGEPKVSRLGIDEGKGTRTVDGAEIEEIFLAPTHGAIQQLFVEPVVGESQLAELIAGKVDVAEDPWNLAEDIGIKIGAVAGDSAGLFDVEIDDRAKVWVSETVFEIGMN